MTLNEYKQKQSYEYGLGHDTWEAEYGYEHGFDECIELELPIKFAKWFNSKDQSWKDWQRKNFISHSNQIEKAYRYWLENILKIE